MTTSHIFELYLYKETFGTNATIRCSNACTERSQQNNVGVFAADIGIGITLPTDSVHGYSNGSEQ